MLSLKVQNGLPDLIFDPFCKFKASQLEANCLKLRNHRTIPAIMMLALRQATAKEVSELLNPNPDDDPRPLPSAQEIKRFYIIKESAQALPFVIAPLFGSEAITIIIPDGAKLSGGQIGHNQLYIGGAYRYGDPLCQSIKQHSLAALPLKFTGPDLAYAQACEA